MFQKSPPETDTAGEYIVDFITESGLVKAKLFKQSIGTVAHGYLKSDEDMAGDPFFGPIVDYLRTNGLPRLSFMHMHYES